MAQNYAQQETKTPTRRNWLALVTLGLALAITIIDATIVNVTIPSIRDEFGASLRDLEWISAIYALVYAAFIITWGRLSDVLGRRLIFLIGNVVFVLGSLIVGVAGALGPILGGYLTTNIDWRWAFLVNIPIGVLVILGTFLFVDESKGREAGKGIELDIPGIALAAIGLAALVFGLIEGPTYGWWTTKAQFVLGGFSWPDGGIAITPVMFALSVVFLAAFVFWEASVARRGRTPLFDFGLLKYRGFRFGLLTVLIVALGEFGILFILSIYYQSVRGLSAFDTGIAFLPLAIGSFIAAPSAGILSARFGAKWIVTSGMLIEAISIFLLGRIVGVDTPLLWFTPVLGLYGIGVGLAIAQLTNVTLSDIPMQYAGVGSGANNTVRQVGAAVGIAVLGAILTAQIAATGKEQLAADTTIPSFIKAPIEQALDSGLTGESFQTPTGPGGQTDPAIAGAIQTVFGEAISSGVRSAATVASIFVLLGAVSSFLIPNPKKREEGEGKEAGQMAEAAAHG